MADKEFVAGMFTKQRTEKTPDWILIQLSFKLDEFIADAKAHVNDAGYVNCVMKKSAGGKLYWEWDLWKPTQSSEQQAQAYVQNNPPPQAPQPEFDKF